MVDLRNSEMDGQQGEDLLAQCGITINRNTVPFDPRPTSVSMAVRTLMPKDADVEALKARVDKLAEDFPLYPGLDQIH